MSVIFLLYFCPELLQSCAGDEGGSLETYQMLIPGRGTVGNLMVPEKRLSRWGS